MKHLLAGAACALALAACGSDRDDVSYTPTPQPVAQLTPVERCLRDHPELPLVIESVDTVDNRQIVALDIQLQGFEQAALDFKGGVLSSGDATQDEADCAWIVLVDEWGLG